jgi:hypothetical protein
MQQQHQLQHQQQQQPNMTTSWSQNVVWSSPQVQLALKTILSTSCSLYIAGSNLQLQSEDADAKSMHPHGCSPSSLKQYWEVSLHCSHDMAE